MPGLPTHLVQELNVGTVDHVCDELMSILFDVLAEIGNINYMQIWSV